MLDIETAFINDNYSIFLRLEQAMPRETLKDCYKLFWKAITEKKYNVATFLMNKPFFNPLLETDKPENWLSLICSMPSLLESACKLHIDKSRISTSDALKVINASLRFNYMNKKSVGLFIQEFNYQELSQGEVFQASYLLGNLLSKEEWYWAREVIEWGLEINNTAMEQWATAGFHIKRGKKGGWPNKEIEDYRKKFLYFMLRANGVISKNIVNNGHIDAFIFIAKQFKDTDLKNRFVTRITQAALSNPSSDFTIFISEKFPTLICKLFVPDEKWAKKAAQRKTQNISKAEAIILSEKMSEIEYFTVKECNLIEAKCAQDILQAIKCLPKYQATLCLRYKGREIGLEKIVPEITRKEHIEMLLSKENDPMTLMLLSTKPNHQAFLMDKLASL
jgi:hypothetical protein